MTTITAERLRELLHYEPKTGTWTHLIASYGRGLGTIAGCRHRGHGYIVIKIDGRGFLAHRLAWFYMTGAWPVADIDHINMARDDNRWCNLREATRSQNMANEGTRMDSTSGFKCVSWGKSQRKWVARIGLNGNRMHLGYFDTKERAYIAYMAAAYKHFGDFMNIDCPLFVQYRALKAERAEWDLGYRKFEALWNLAHPDHLIAA